MSETPAHPGLIFQAIPNIMEEVGAIGKTRRNAQQGYSFRGIDDVYAAVQLVFAKHGVFVVPAVTAQKREERPSKGGGVLTYTVLTVIHTFYASDGSHVDAVTVGEAMDSGDKSTNKAMSAAMKYALLETFCIPTDEPKDVENDSPAPQQKPRETVNKTTGEVTGAPDDDPLAGVGNFRKEVFAACQARGVDRKAAVEWAKEKKGVKSLEELPLPSRRGLIAAIKGGKLDHLKSEPEKAAEPAAAK